ncbi:SRPBCC family protein [Hyphomicrobium sp.]|uniref:SRPBCC family protein n=1 Tax=Hyphomicrobium sp. TaxID=82 RepID=UPI000FC16CE0|nr:SRPBCC family protein [Hyphomicrobium sp.]RUO98512.1 MAG: SRPBCC family protein [Hyphomicrobium sp.]
MLLRLRAALLIIGIASCSGATFAHGPTPQKVDEKITIAAQPDEVWKVVKDFASIASWHPAVSKIKVEGSGNETTRTVTLKSGGELVDSLDAVDDKAMELNYRLQNEDFAALPVSSYSMAITVQPADGGSQVEWISRLYRFDTGNEPPEDKNDDAAVKATTEFIKAGLNGLKTKLESKK